MSTAISPPTEEDAALMEEFRTSFGVADMKFAYQWRESTPKPSYFCYPLAPKGVTVLVAGREKSGKSKLVYSLLANIERGLPFAGEPAERAKVMMFQEEPATVIKKHADELDLGPDVRFPISRMASLHQIRRIIPRAAEHGYKVFCLDTGSRFLGIENENDPALVARAVGPLEDLASELALTIFINLHANKNKANTALDILRGSTAYAGSASHIITVLPVGQTTQRVIEIFGRLEHNARFTLDHDLTTHTYAIARDESNTLAFAGERPKGAAKLCMEDFLAHCASEELLTKAQIMDRGAKTLGVTPRTVDRWFGKALLKSLIVELDGRWKRA